MSLLPLAGMFIFGGKKKVEEKTPNLPESIQAAIQRFHASANKGYIKLVAEADPEKNEDRVMRIMEAEPWQRETNIYLRWR